MPTSNFRLCLSHSHLFLQLKYSSVREMASTNLSPYSPSIESLPKTISIIPSSSRDFCLLFKFSCSKRKYSSGLRFKRCVRVRVSYVVHFAFARAGAACVGSFSRLRAPPPRSVSLSMAKAAAIFPTLLCRNRRRSNGLHDEKALPDPK